MSAGGTIEVYQTANPVIRWLSDRLTRGIGERLRAIRAPSLSGIDVGCGEGQLLGKLSTAGVLGSVVAVDLDAERLRHAEENHAVCRYLRADVFRLPHPSDAFDYALAAEILEHLPDPGRALEELARVCRPGAPLIVSVPHEPWFHWGNLVRGKHWHRGGRTPAHLNFWNRAEFESFLGRYGAIEESISVFPWLVYCARFPG